MGMMTCPGLLYFIVLRTLYLAAARTTDEGQLDDVAASSYPQGFILGRNMDAQISKLHRSTYQSNFDDAQQMEQQLEKWQMSTKQFQQQRQQQYEAGKEYGYRLEQERYQQQRHRQPHAPHHFHQNWFIEQQRARQQKQISPREASGRLIPPGSMAQPSAIDSDRALLTTRLDHPKKQPNQAYMDGYQAGLEMVLKEQAQAGNAGAALQQQRTQAMLGDPGLGEYKGPTSKGQTAGDCVHNENGTWSCGLGGLNANAGSGDFQWEEEPDGESRLVFFVPADPIQWQWYTKGRYRWNQAHRRRGTWRWLSGYTWKARAHNLDAMDEGEPASSIDESIMPADYEHDFAMSTPDRGWDPLFAQEHVDVDKYKRATGDNVGGESLLQAAEEAPSRARTLRREHPHESFPKEAVKELKMVARSATEEVVHDTAIDLDQVVPNMRA